MFGHIYISYSLGYRSLVCYSAGYGIRLYFLHASQHACGRMGKGRRGENQSTLLGGEDGVLIHCTKLLCPRVPPCMSVKAHAGCGHDTNSWQAGGKKWELVRACSAVACTAPATCTAPRHLTVQVYCTTPPVRPVTRTGHRAYRYRPAVKPPSSTALLNARGNLSRRVKQPSNSRTAPSAVRTTGLVSVSRASFGGHCGFTFFSSELQRMIDEIYKGFWTRIRSFNSVQVCVVTLVAPTIFQCSQVRFCHQVHRSAWAAEWPSRLYNATTFTLSPSSHAGFTLATSYGVHRQEQPHSHI